MKYGSCKISLIGVLTAALMLVLPSSTHAQFITGSEVPRIISRAQWGCDESKTTWMPTYAAPKTFIVHHTASNTMVPDPDGTGEYKNMVNAIYLYHATQKSWTETDGGVTVGFGDIGYNYLIDPNGNIYEGRRGGNGVTAGHAFGFNAGTVGISLIGNYETNPTTPQAVNALEQLIGWIASNNGIDVNRTFTFNNKNIDGVVGHRDVAFTLCPGQNLYAQLNEIQNNATPYAIGYHNHIYQTPTSNKVFAISGGYRNEIGTVGALGADYANKRISLISEAQLNAYPAKTVNNTSNPVTPAVNYADGTLLRAAGDTKVYLIEQAKRRWINTTAEQAIALDFKLGDTKEVNQTTLEKYTLGDPIKYAAPEGVLAKDEGNHIFLLQAGRKRPITSAQLFERLGYKWENATFNTDTKFFLPGPAMLYPTGTLLKSRSDGSVFMIENAQKRLITSAQLFERLGYKWESIVNAEPREVEVFPAGKNMIYPDGSLIRTDNAPAIYLVSQAQRRLITSETLLKQLGYNFGQVFSIAGTHLEDYPEGEAAHYPEGALIKTADSPAVYQIRGGGKLEFTSYNLFKVATGGRTDFVTISQPEMALYATTGIVRYPQNSLVRAKGTEKIYLIRGDQATWISSAEEFLRAGYKWENVMSIAAEELSLYTIVQSSETPQPNPTPTPSPAPAVSAAPNIRIAIQPLTSGNVTITANGKYIVEYYDTNAKLTQSIVKNAGEPTVTAYFADASLVKFIPTSREVILQLSSYADPSWDKTNDNNRFRGNLELKFSTVSQKLWVINELNMEDYLNGLGEASNSSPEEYLRAFSMITRSYALYHLERGGKHKGEPFHLKNSRNGNGNDQVYKGYDMEMRAAPIVAANQKATGQIIKYGPNTIVAAYSSDSGGVTKSACEVWNQNNPNGFFCQEDMNYLDGGVKDPDNTPHNEARIAASHGVGMSAIGAVQMALNGENAERIISHYYPGTSIVKIY